MAARKVMLTMSWGGKLVMTPHEVNTGSAHQTLMMKYLDHGG